MSDNKDKKKVKVSIEITFEDYADFKLHYGMVREKINAFLKNPTDRDLSEGSESSAWSNHKFTIEEIPA